MDLASELAESVASRLSFRDTWPKDEDHAWAVDIVKRAIEAGQIGFTIDTAIGKVSGDKLVGYVSKLEFAADVRGRITQKLYELYGGKGECSSIDDMAIRVVDYMQDASVSTVRRIVKEMLTEGKFRFVGIADGVKLELVE